MNQSISQRVNSLPSSLFLTLTLRAHFQRRPPEAISENIPVFSVAKNNKMINPLSKKNKNQTKNKHFKTALTRAQNINFTKTDKFGISKNVWTQFQVIVLFEPFCDFLPFSFKTKRARRSHGAPLAKVTLYLNLNI